MYTLYLLARQVEFPRIGDSRHCCCVPCLLQAVNSLWLLILHIFTLKITIACISAEQYVTCTYITHVDKYDRRRSIQQHLSRSSIKYCRGTVGKKNNTKTYSCYGSKQTLASLSDSVLCLMKITHARLLSDTSHCPTATSQSVCRRTELDGGLGAASCYVMYDRTSIIKDAKSKWINK